MLKVAIWAAVSSEEQAKADKDSIPDQQRATRAKVAELGGSVVAELVVEESRELLDFTTACATIDAYARLRALADAKSIDVLVFLNRGRLGRTAAVVESLALYCLRSGVALYDLSAPPSSLVAREQLHNSGDQLNGVIQSWRYQNELSELRRRHRAGMASRTKKGFFPSNVPVGWKKQFDSDGKPYIVIDEKTAEAVREIVRLYAAGTHISVIGEALTQSGHKTSGKPRKIQSDRVSGQWTRSAIKTVLDRVWQYAGYTEYNQKSKTGRDFIRERSAHIPPIIDDAMVQAVLAERDRRTINQVPKDEHLFSGAVQCTKCNTKMICMTKGNRIRRKKDGTLTAYPVLCCNGCRRNVAWTKVEKALVDYLDTVDKVGCQVTESAQGESETLKSEAEKVQVKINAVSLARARAYSAYVDELVDRDTWQAEAKRLDKREKELKDSLLVLHRRIAAAAPKAISQERFKYVGEIGRAMLEKSKTEPGAMNRWIRENLCINFNEDRSFTIKTA